MKSASFKAALPRPIDFWADLEVAFGWDDVDKEAPAVGKGETTRSSADEKGNIGSSGHDPRGGGINARTDRAVVSLVEPSGGAPLRCKPASITVASDDGRRAVRVCVATENCRESSPTKHVLLYQDPQPGLTICNRAAGTVTLMFDCGTWMEVGPGETAEHSWPEVAGRDRNASGRSVRRPPRPSTPSPLDQRGPGLSGAHFRCASEDSPFSSPMSSAPGSPAARARVSTPRSRTTARLSSARGNSPEAGKARGPQKLFGTADATLQHWFRCKGGSRGDEYSSWSNPLWVARGVQVIRCDRHAAREGVLDDEQGSDWGYDGTWGGDSSGGGDGGRFGVGSIREVQVHVMERAGGFVMSFLEGGFEGVTAADGEPMGGEGGAIAAEESR